LKSDARRFFIKLRAVLVLGLKKLNLYYFKGVSKDGDLLMESDWS
jgi:hypothetical protein